MAVTAVTAATVVVQVAEPEVVLAVVPVVVLEVVLAVVPVVVLEVVLAVVPVVVRVEEPEVVVLAEEFAKTLTPNQTLRANVYVKKGMP
jgi:hypothetical protein